MTFYKFRKTATELRYASRNKMNDGNVLARNLGEHGDVMLDDFRL